MTLGTALALAVTGCVDDSSKPGLEAATPDNLGQAEYAVYLSPQSTDLEDLEGKPGRVLLAEDDGQYTAVETSGMDLGLLSWNEAGLFFSDMKADYKLGTSGLETVPSPKTDNQVAAFSLGNGSAIGIYNDGFSEEGYVSQIVTTSNGKASKREVEGNYFIASQCADTIYGASRATGRYSQTDDPDTEPMFFAQLTGTKNDAEHVLGISKTAKEGAVVPDAPCVDGTVYYVSNASESGLGIQAKPVLSTWDTETGKYRQIALKNDSGKKSLMSDDGTSLPQMDSGSIRDGAMEWYGAGNAILSTDLKTGETTHRFDVEGQNNDAASSQVVFTPTEVVQLVDNNDGTEFRIISYDRSTGKEKSRVVLVGLADELPNELIPRGFAVRP